MVRVIKLSENRILFTCCPVSVRIGPERIQLRCDVEVILRHITVAVLGALLVCRRIVLSLLDKFRHLVVGGLGPVFQVVDSSQTLVGSGVLDVESIHVAIGRFV